MAKLTGLHTRLFGVSAMSEMFITISSPHPRVAKRIIDVVLASVMLLLCSPLLAVAAILVRLSSPGPILFRQTRVGADGRTFVMLKLRSLELLEDNVPFDQLKRRGEIRYIRIWGFNLGRWLRITRFDEVVQGLNVLRGQMSMVGLRPALPSETEVLAWREAQGLANFPVGMTGLYQTGGSKELPNDRRMELECKQVASWSYLGDLRILFDTVFVVLRRKGAGE